MFLLPYWFEVTLVLSKPKFDLLSIKKKIWKEIHFLSAISRLYPILQKFSWDAMSIQGNSLQLPYDTQ